MSIVIGLVTAAATVIGAFVFGWPSIITVIINYVKRGEARGYLVSCTLACQDIFINE